ncbi:MAG: DNA internalization-related competence protein ComEC/Rec2 [Marmoricola sp.]
MSEERRVPDLRMPVLGAVAWGSALAAMEVPGRLLVALVAGCGGWLVFAWWRGRLSWTRVGWVVAGLAVAAGTTLRLDGVHRSPVAALARQRAEVSVEVQVRSDPRVVRGRFGTTVMLRAETREVVGRGRRFAARAPILVFADPRWRSVTYGARLRVPGRLSPARTSDLAGVLSARGPPHLLAGPGVLQRLSGGVRTGIRDAVADQRPVPRALVPALVDGDDTRLPDRVQEQFRTTGLTHLLAVSGTNLTLVVGFLVVLARALGVRARGLTVVGFLGVGGFVLLARAEPSVLRAAMMGSVALLGLGRGGRDKGVRAWGVAVFCLMLLDPWLATSAGFALSAAATAGILWLGPPWRDSLCRWLPRWLAEAIAVPLAAQLACTPLIAALSGRVSLVAVACNMAAAPVVGPATVLGLSGGVVAVAVPALGRLLATPAAWCAEWIVTVAAHGAGLPVAAGQVPTSPAGLLLLTLVCLTTAAVLGAALARRTTTLCLCGLLALAVLVPLPTPGWPPRGWVMVACDVGQGDGLVLHAGRHTAVVVDSGPAPTAMAACLRRLGVQRVPLVVLTHDHADHVDGLAGVLRGRRVGGIEVTTLPEPAYGARNVREVAARAHVPVSTVRLGEVRTVGALRWQVLAPSGAPPADSDSPPNDASIVMLVQTRGIRILLMGDEETGTQQRLAARFPRLHAAVLKVAHHGSAKQDPELVRRLDARLAVISVGKHNDYGHPAPSTLGLLHDAGMRVERTDLDGDVAVVVRHGLRVVTRP